MSRTKKSRHPEIVTKSLLQESSITRIVLFVQLCSDCHGSAGKLHMTLDMQGICIRLGGYMKDLCMHA